MSNPEALVVQEHRPPFLKTLVIACLPGSLILFYISIRLGSPLLHNTLQIAAFAAFAVFVLGGIKLKKSRYSIKLEPHGDRLHVAFITQAQHIHEDYIPFSDLGAMKIGSLPDALFPVRLPFQGVDLKFRHNRTGDSHSLFQLGETVVPIDQSSAQSVISYLAALRNDQS